MKELSEIWLNIPLSWKITFFICLGVTIVLLIAGFILPPPGKVDESVFKACAIISIYPTLFTIFICILKGMNVNYNIKEGKFTVTSTNDDTTENN